MEKISISILETISITKQYLDQQTVWVVGNFRLDKITGVCICVFWVSGFVGFNTSRYSTFGLASTFMKIDYACASFIAPLPKDISHIESLHIFTLFTSLLGTSFSFRLIFKVYWFQNLVPKNDKFSNWLRS